MRGIRKKARKSKKFGLGKISILYLLIEASALLECV